jgi:hypothetical protein
MRLIKQKERFERELRRQKDKLERELRRQKARYDKEIRNYERELRQQKAEYEHKLQEKQKIIDIGFTNNANLSGNVGNNESHGHSHNNESHGHSHNNESHGHSHNNESHSRNTNVTINIFPEKPYTFGIADMTEASVRLMKSVYGDELIAEIVDMSRAKHADIIELILNRFHNNEKFKNMQNVFYCNQGTHKDKLLAFIDTKWYVIDARYLSSVIQKIMNSVMSEMDIKKVLSDGRKHMMQDIKQYEDVLVKIVKNFARSNADLPKQISDQYHGDYATNDPNKISEILKKDIKDKVFSNLQTSSEKGVRSSGVVDKEDHSSQTESEKESEHSSEYTEDLNMND